MNKFLKYQSVKQPHKYLLRQRDTFLQKDLWVFPKLDGANTSIWLQEDGTLGLGSRNTDLSKSMEGFNGFREFIMEREDYFLTILQDFKAFSGHDCTIYGEWLVPHTVKTYTEDMWKKFWIFDVAWMDELEQLNYVHYENQQFVLETKHGYEYLIPLLSFHPDGLTVEQLEKLPDTNKFGIREDGGHGEGVVIKNYDFAGHTWMKVIHPDFSGRKALKACVTKNIEREKKIVEHFMDAGLVEKEYAKLMNEDPEMNKGQLIPRLMGQVYHSFIEDNMIAILRKEKNPTIDFKVIKKLTDQGVRYFKKELF